MENKIEHIVAVGGTGLHCLTTGASYYGNMGNIGTKEFQEKVFAYWDKEHNAIHRAATKEEIDTYNKGLQ